tara:strand:+ start:1508 stop:2443 length:936 start_codon:yes stop_codon:yes gene_type:complete
MIITKCPLRISLAGGSTDLQDFIDYYGKGSVINFPVNLYTYIMLSSDICGPNKIFGKYIINYTKREEEEKVENIKNDVAREVLKYFNCKQIICTFYSDISSSGSGLASSSSYMLALVKAVSKFKNIQLSSSEICKISLEIEKRFNKHTGYQDIYGCGIGSLKRINFEKDSDPNFTYLSQNIFKDMKMYLIFTNVTRKSTDLLSNLDLKKREDLLDLVNLLEKSIKQNNKTDFFGIINEGWRKKKEVSPLVMNNSRVAELDENLTRDKNVLSHRLCGAGGGGFFLVFTKEEVADNRFIPISISEEGLRGISI